jgi:GntR family transcriptional regulator of vanillate catabolism
VTLPFASPNGFVMSDRGGPHARDRLVIAHEQHHAIVDAIVRREGARAESVTREHARNAQRNLADLLAQQGKVRPLQTLPARAIGPRRAGTR